MGKTVGTLAAFIIIGLLPKVPWWAKILIQVVVGAAIYFSMPDGEFPLPYPDSNPIGNSLYGGNAAKAWDMPDAPKFAYLSMGVLGTVIGFLSTAAGTVIGLVLKKKAD